MKILFLQAGGTIDKDYPMTDTNHGYNFEISTPAYERILQRVSPSFKFVMKSVIQKDSTDMNDADRELLKKYCCESEIGKIIITHGTDTMLQTAKVVSEITDKAIVLTGALKPERFKDSDADFNVGAAVGALSILDSGTYIAMGGRVMPWDRVTFDDSQGQFIQI